MKKKLSENISSNSLFHFTNELDFLIGILSHNFKPRYCLERTEFFKDETLMEFEMAYPMVCFCDLPLSKMKSHIGYYGDYGIGMSKEWGFRNNLSPIHYSYTDARTSLNLASIIWYYKEYYNTNETEPARRLNTMISDFLMFTKPYYGKIKRNGKLISKRFYDEREWRWIPKIEHPDVFIHLDKNAFSQKEVLEHANRLVAQHYGLRFQPNDIKYLILRNENEIDKFIRNIERIKSRFDPETVKRLTTRIITKDQILYDL